MTISNFVTSTAAAWRITTKFATVMYLGIRTTISILLKIQLVSFKLMLYTIFSLFSPNRNEWSLYHPKKQTLGLLKNCLESLMQHSDIWQIFKRKWLLNCIYKFSLDWDTKAAGIMSSIMNIWDKYLYMGLFEFPPPNIISWKFIIF